jgi:hypothetical protein
MYMDKIEHQNGDQRGVCDENVKKFNEGPITVHTGKPLPGCHQGTANPYIIDY